MRELASIAIALIIYAVAFTALRIAGLFGASALFDWLLLAAAATLAIFLSRPISWPRSLLLFAVTGVLAFLIAILISYIILGDSF